MEVWFYGDEDRSQEAYARAALTDRSSRLRDSFLGLHAHRQLRSLPCCDAASNLTHRSKAAALQQARSDGRTVPARAINEQGTVLRQGCQKAHTAGPRRSATEHIAWKVRTDRAQRSGLPSKKNSDRRSRVFLDSPCTAYFRKSSRRYGFLFFRSNPILTKPEPRRSRVAGSGTADTEDDVT